VAPRGRPARPTHVVAFAVFERLWRDGRARDLTRFLTDVAPDASVDEVIVEADVAKLLEELRKLAEAGVLQPPVDEEAKVAIARAMRTSRPITSGRCSSASKGACASAILRCSRTTATGSMGTGCSGCLPG